MSTANPTETRDVIRLSGVSKRYADVYAVRDVALTVARGEILALLGSSGCGKTTTLRLIAGLEAPDAGAIWLDERPVAGVNGFVTPEDRHVGMVFQDYALFPHLDAAANIAFPLNRLDRQSRRQRVDAMLTLAGLHDLGGRYPHELSGGQQQRVALARALAAHPAVVLLDEPFSNLDAALRKSTREEVRRILKAAGQTAVFVTHDQEEALSIADRVAVMRAGRILQIDTPRTVYLHPATRDVAAFVGEANFLPGTAHGDHVETALGPLPLHVPVSGAVEVLLRPEALSLTPDETGQAVVAALRFYGHYQTAEVTLDDQTALFARLPATDDLRAGVRVCVTVDGAVMAYAR